MSESSTNIDARRRPLLAGAAACVGESSTLRQRMEAAVEALLAALDAMDGDPDLEPSLGAVAHGWFSDQRRWAQGASDEREEACEDEGVRPDDEPDAPDGGVDYELHDQTKPGTYSGAPLIDPWRQA